MVLFVRGGVVLCIIILVMFAIGDLNATPEAELTSLPVLAACLVLLLLYLVYFIPYLRILYRRLQGLLFPFSRTLTLLVAAFLITANGVLALSFSHVALYYLMIAEFCAYLSIYLLLLPWPDRPDRTAYPGNRI